MGIISHEGMPRKLTQEKFAERATKVHDGKYDYSLVCYINTASKVKIICSEHGIFEQSPNSHLAGHGCPECVGRGKSNNERFIRNAKGKHGDKYDYSLVNFVDSKTKVKIICPTHGIFEQLPSQHFIYGCNKCAIQARTHTLEYFANQANIVHDGKYDYKLVNYINNCTKVDIICPTHGIFRQTPAAHLFGFGCHGCGIDSTKLTLDEIIGRANIVHDFKYDYSLAVYISSHDNIEIICPTHGVFKQQVGNHLFGSGCRKCSKSVSKSETLWLNGLNVPRDYRQRTIVINKRRFNVDAYDPGTNVIYEFYGDFWHGNPEIYNLNDFNWVKHKTFGELYSNTIERERCIKNAGYNLFSIWENDFNKQLCQ